MSAQQWRALQKLHSNKFLFGACVSAFNAAGGDPDVSTDKDTGGIHWGTQHTFGASFWQSDGHNPHNNVDACGTFKLPINANECIWAGGIVDFDVKQDAVKASFGLHAKRLDVLLRAALGHLVLEAGEEINHEE